MNVNTDSDDDETSDISAAGVALTTSISNIEDDPTFSAITDLAITEDNAGSDTTGDARTIGTIFASFFSDVDSGQTLQGIAIGSYEFSGIDTGSIFDGSRGRCRTDYIVFCDYGVGIECF